MSGPACPPVISYGSPSTATTTYGGARVTPAAALNSMQVHRPVDPITVTIAALPAGQDGARDGRRVSASALVIPTGRCQFFVMTAY
jgi:hypothetical protein